MAAVTNMHRLLAATYELSNLSTREDITSIEAEILTILHTYFQYEYSLFWSIQNGELQQQPVRHNITKKAVEQYLAIFKEYDPHQPKRIADAQNAQHLGESIFKTRCYYSDFLRMNQYKDQLVMYLHDRGTPTAVISLLRMDDEASFTTCDCTQLSYMKQTIENVYLLHQYRKPPVKDCVTKREDELLQYLCKGYKNADIAAQMFVSENTIKKHLQNLYRKFGVCTRTELVMKYIAKS